MATFPYRGGVGNLDVVHDEWTSECEAIGRTPLTNACWCINTPAAVVPPPQDGQRWQTQMVQCVTVQMLHNVKSLGRVGADFRCSTGPRAGDAYYSRTERRRCPPNGRVGATRRPGRPVNRDDRLIHQPFRTSRQWHIWTDGGIEWVRIIRDGL